MEKNKEDIENFWRGKIKELAKAHHLSVKNLLALAPKNDPFYIGSETEIVNALWAYRTWKRMTTEQNKKDVYLRGMHYWYASFSDSKRPDGKPYQNTDADWAFMLQAGKHARYLDLIPCDGLTDEKNPDPIINAEYYKDLTFSKAKEKINVNNIADAISNAFHLIWGQNYQPYLIEAWCEKEIKKEKGMPDIITRYSINLVTGKGELSITSVDLALERIRKAGKPARIYYIMDFDPKGVHMPISIARKFEWFTRKYKDFDIRLKPLALTKKQCIDDYKLPREPIKLGKGGKSGAKAYDTLKEKFEGKFGEGATELNALEGLYHGELARIIEDAVKPYWNFEIEKQVRAFNNSVKKLVKEAVLKQDEKLKKFIDSIDFSKAKKEADTWNIKPSDIEGIEENEDWLFDSKREYIKQLKAYKFYKMYGTVDGLDDDYQADDELERRDRYRHR